MEKVGYGSANTIKSAEVLGKKVLTDGGKEIGKVSEIMIDSDDFVLAGIVVHRGIIDSDLFVGRNYIRSAGKDGVILKVTPASEYIGMKVFDPHGKEVGKVKALRRVGKTNEISSITINQGIGKKDILVPAEMVENIGENVILSEETDE